MNRDREQSGDRPFVLVGHVLDAEVVDDGLGRRERQHVVQLVRERRTEVLVGHSRDLHLARDGVPTGNTDHHRPRAEPFRPDRRLDGGGERVDVDDLPLDDDARIERCLRRAHVTVLHHGRNPNVAVGRQQPERTAGARLGLGRGSLSHPVPSADSG